MTPKSPPGSLLLYLLPCPVCKGLCQWPLFGEQHYYDTVKDHNHDRNYKVRRLSRYQMLQMSFRPVFRTLPPPPNPFTSKPDPPPFSPQTSQHSTLALAKQGLQHQDNHHSANPLPLPILTLKLSSTAPSSSNALRRVGPFKSLAVLISDVGNHCVALADFHDVV